MTVKELIEALREMPEELEVFFDDGDFDHINRIKWVELFEDEVLIS